MNQGEKGQLEYKIMIAEVENPSKTTIGWGDWTGEFATADEAVDHIQPHMKKYPYVFGLFKYYKEKRYHWNLIRRLN